MAEAVGVTHGTVFVVLVVRVIPADDNLLAAHADNGAFRVGVAGVSHAVAGLEHVAYLGAVKETTRAVIALVALVFTWSLSG